MTETAELVPRKSRSRDGCAVETASLSVLLGDFVQRWMSAWGGGQLAGAFAIRSDVSPVSPYEWLEQESGVPQEFIEKVVRYRPGTRQTSPYVELSVADRLVTAIDRTDVFYGDEPAIRIIPNPRAARVRQDECRRELAACCGGSTF